MDELANRFLGLVYGGWVPQALYVAAELNVADALAAGPRTADELAAETNVDPDALFRLLRALVTIEIVEERPEGRFALLPLGALLRRDASPSLHAHTLLQGAYHWSAWGHLLDCVRTGRSARSLQLGTEGFAHLQADARWASVFHQAMVELTSLVAPSVVRAYDFSAARRIVDVGGGYGELLCTILAACPAAEGVLFDQPHALASARSHVERTGLADRCELVEGDFFDSVPAGADVYVLKSIVHDWNDERSRTILSNCRRAMAPGGRVVVIERLMPEALTASAADRTVVRSDLNMLVALAARERTEAQFRDLFTDAGLRLNRVLVADLGFSVLEAVALS